MAGDDPTEQEATARMVAGEPAGDFAGYRRREVVGARASVAAVERLLGKTP